MRFMQGVISLGLVAAIALVVVFTNLSIADLFASILAFIPTGWMIICVSYIQHFLLKTVNVGKCEKENEMLPNFFFFLQEGKK